MGRFQWSALLQPLRVCPGTVVQGTVVQRQPRVDAAACCAACAATPACNAWSYSLCETATSAQGDCLLKNLQYPDYPALDFTLQVEYRLKWLSGVTAAKGDIINAADCQPSDNSCGLNWQGCPNFMELLECASDSACGTLVEATTYYKDGSDVVADVITLSANSYRGTLYLP